MKCIILPWNALFGVNVKHENNHVFEMLLMRDDDILITSNYMLSLSDLDRKTYPLTLSGSKCMESYL